MFCICVAAVPAAAQDAPPEHDHSQHEHAMTPASSSRWTWAADANVIAGFNYQNRRYFDFAAWESQNWLMGTARRTARRGQVSVLGMLSLEPLTIGRDVYRVDDGSHVDGGGSPQLFQTGETYKGLPLMEYQHPHDLIMELGATYERPIGPLTYEFGADVVGSPTLGPTPFMHRESARSNPQVPLSHHLLDSTHSTPGVVRGAVRLSAWTLEASAFRGREPDEQRYELDRPRLDSWAARVGWHRGGWDAQFSGGHLHQPEAYSIYDQTRWTGSVGYTGALLARPIIVTAAYGRMLEHTPYSPVSHGGLLEWEWRASGTLTAYGRAEAVRKEVVGLHAHTKDTPPHPTYLSDVGALTLGAVQDLTVFGLNRFGRFGIGGDITVYSMSVDLQPIYGGSRSFHAFVRWRPSTPSTAHDHHS